MSKQALEFFGRTLMEEVRDQVIEEFERIRSGKMKGRMAERLRAQLEEHPGSGEILDEVIPLVVDSTMHSVLEMLDQQSPHLRLLVENPERTAADVSAVSDGLAGELYGEGWILKFSRHPQSLLGRD